MVYAVQLVGVCEAGGLVMLVSELVERGSLDRLLHLPETRWYARLVAVPCFGFGVGGSACKVISGGSNEVTKGFKPRNVIHSMAGIFRDVLVHWAPYLRWVNLPGPRDN